MDDAYFMEETTITIVNAPEYFFEVYPSKSKYLRRKQWRWRLRHRNGKIIAVCSEGYNNEADMNTAFDNLIRGLIHNDFVTRRCSK